MQKPFVSIFIDHFVTSEIINQTFLITSNTNKLNFRLIRASQFFFTFSIKIKIKFEKLHVISNVLSHLNSFVFSEHTSILKNLNDVNSLNIITDVNFLIIIIVFKFFFSWNVNSHRIHETLKNQLKKRLFLLKMNEKFVAILKEIYESNNQWRKIKIKLRVWADRTNTFDDIKFILKNNHVCYVSKKIISQFCISWNLNFFSRFDTW